MLEDILIKEARRRKEIFENLSTYLIKLKETIKNMDSNGKLFLFGSTARGENILTSDIDVLILTSLNPNLVIATLRQAGFDDPFEFHVMNYNQFETYKHLIKNLKEI